jgi:hypothetical protein
VRIIGAGSSGFAANVNALGHVEVALHQWAGGVLPNATLLAESQPNPVVPMVGGFGMLWNGSGWDRARGATDGQLVKFSQLMGVTGTIQEAAASVATHTFIAQTISSMQLAGVNPTRIGFHFFNAAANIFYLLFGPSGTVANCSLPVPCGIVYEMPKRLWSGVISGAWDQTGLGTGLASELMA